MIERLGMAAEYRDDDTGQHTRRVGQCSAQLAAALGLPPEEIELVARAAPLHDVGKIAVPDHILLKNGPLTAEERQIMRSHTTVGGQLLAGSHSELLKTARESLILTDGGGVNDRKHIAADAIHRRLDDREHRRRRDGRIDGIPALRQHS